VLEAHAEHERWTCDLVELATSAGKRLESLTPEERKTAFDMFDVKVVLGDATILGKPGVRCAVSEWHWTTGTKVPPDPDGEQWQKGAWPEVMRSLDADTTGVDAYRRPSLPPLTVTAQLRAGLFVDVRE
jgi:hypothetical protein